MKKTTSIIAAATLAAFVSAAPATAEGVIVVPGAAGASVGIAPILAIGGILLVGVALSSSGGTN